ncbi:MAG TPA: hypothetical protein VGB07_24155 [Blastocatellia bacterium]
MNLRWYEVSRGRSITPPVSIFTTLPDSAVHAGFFSGAIGAQKMSVLGGEVLKQFNLIFDIADNHLYIAPRR